MADRPVLTLRKTLRETGKEPEEMPGKLRFVERQTRYILQELVDDISASLTGAVRWRDVPLVRNP